MFEMIGLIIGLFILSSLSLLISMLIAAGAWFLFWGRRRPKRLILLAAAVPLFSFGYVLLCAIAFAHLCT